MLPVTPTSAEESRRPKLFRRKGFHRGIFRRKARPPPPSKGPAQRRRRDPDRAGSAFSPRPFRPPQYPSSTTVWLSIGAGFSAPKVGGPERASETRSIDYSRPHLVVGRTGAHPHRMHSLFGVPQLARHAHQRSGGRRVGHRMGACAPRSSPRGRHRVGDFGLRVGAFRAATLRRVRHPLNPTRAGVLEPEHDAQGTLSGRRS